MTQADYNATLAGLNASMEDEVGVQLAANKAAVVGLFPGLWAWLIRGLLWPCLLKIGRVIGSALVAVVLKRLGQMTLAEVAAFLVKFMGDRNMSVNPNLKLAGDSEMDEAMKSTETLVRSGVLSQVRTFSDHDLFAGADPEPETKPNIPHEEICKISGNKEDGVKINGWPAKDWIEAQESHEARIKANRPGSDSPPTPFIRSTQVYAYHYSHNGETFCETLRAYDFDDAEARCKALGVVLDGVVS